MVLKRYFGDRAFYKYVLSVSLPIMLQNGLTNFVSMLDNIMVGRVGTVEMTGVAVANQLIFIFSLCVFGAVSGAGIFGAQFYGKKDNEGLRYTFRFKFLFCVALSVLGILIFILYGRPLINEFLKGDGSVTDAAGTLSAGTEYLRVMLVGLAPFALIQCYSSTLRETGETVLPMKACIAAVFINLFLNYVLIFGHFGSPALGVTGAAIATVISRFVELGIIVIWTHLHKQRNSFIVGAYRSMRIPKALTAKMFANGAPLMINETLWATGIAVINQSYSTRGLDVVAANTILQTFWNVFSVAFMAVGTAIGIIIGQTLGSGQLAKAKETARHLIVFSLLTGIAVGSMFAVCAKFIPFLYNTSDAVRSTATGLMLISACFMPVSAFVHGSYFTLRSGGKTLITFIFDSGFVCLITVPLAFVISRYTNLPILPFYFCCQSVDLIKCVMGYIFLRKGIWIRNIVDTEKPKIGVI